MKKIYSQKFEWNSINCLTLSMLVLWWLFHMIVGIFGGMDLASIIFISSASFFLLYFLIWSFVSIKKNLFDIYDDHIEIAVFKLFILRKYNLKFDEIESISTFGLWNIIVNLKNGKVIKILGYCLPKGKGTYYESKKFLNAVKKIGF